MPTRTTHQTVEFTRPFSLAGVQGTHPAGFYGVDTDEETIDGLSFTAWRRVATFLTVSKGGTTQVHAVDPLDLDAALQLDAGNGRDGAVPHGATALPPPSGGR